MILDSSLAARKADIKYLKTYLCLLFILVAAFGSLKATIFDKKLAWCKYNEEEEIQAMQRKYLLIQYSF